MPPIKCYITNCDFSTPDVDSAVGAVILGHHLSSAHPNPAPTKVPTIPQPKVSGTIYEDEWDSFTREWAVYKGTVSIATEMLPVYLLACCSSDLKSSVEKANPTITTKSETEVLAAIKRHAVVSVAASVLRTELFYMKQDHGETVLAFSSRALGKARNCKLTVRCPHNTDVDYSEDMVKQVVLAGMSDDEIKRKVLSTPGIDDMSLNDTIAIIEMEEMASRSMSDHPTTVLNQASSTSYKKRISSSDRRLQTKGKCASCSTEFLIHRIKKQAGKEDILLTDKFCKSCWQKRCEARRGNSKRSSSTPDNNEAGGSAKSEDFPYLCSVNAYGGQCSSSDEITSYCAANHMAVPMPHHIFDGTKGWMQTPVEPHPTITLTAFTTESDYNHLRLPCPTTKPTKVTVVTDSGCQSSLIGLKVMYKLGLKKSCLVPVKGKMSAINGEGINILGAVFLRLEGTDTSTGQSVQTAVMAHATESTDRFYISRQAMRELGIIPHDFPKIHAPPINAASSNTELAIAPCGCPKHQLPPKRPGSLPYEPVEKNVDAMKLWLLDFFSSSTFNRCPHQRLPMMKGDPIKIHIDPEAIPKPVYTASTVPIHWREEIHEQLNQDVALGIIEPVPAGVPTTWQSRMHVVAKHDGTPRRTVDLRALNIHCKRESQHVVPPYKQARSVPNGVFKTVTDCWNGYHSCPLAEEDRHLTTFITEWGRYRYCAAPQGFKAAGDGYNQRYDNLIADIARKSKCVDDVIIWDENLEKHWWRIIDYLILVGTNGIILNPQKFQFCHREVEFAGFLITEEDVKPLPKYLDAIREFPRPTNISEIRSWFGLVNQVSHYGKLTDLMAPFKPLLSPKTRFHWDEVLEHAFQESKLEIVKAIEEGVKIFDPCRITALSPDWSKTGIGYFMYQKYCECPSTITTCCDNGWHITLAGSRFLHKAERNYWPVEGEALAVAWALEDTKFFTLGCSNLHIQTDHRPLVKLLGDKTLDEIDNRRLINLKEKTMAWNFEIHHVPGRLIPAPDATSRSPHDRSSDEFMIDESDYISASTALAAIRVVHEVDDMEMCVIAAARSSLPNMQSVTWERVRDETSRDIYMLQLIDMAEHGFPTTTDLMSPQLIPYWRFRDELSVVDGVLMYGLRAVIPPKLRDEVCAHLHSAHQGVSQMQNRASECVFWPGITSDIQNVRNRCSTCDINAPSQSKLPPADPFIPTSPFQAVATDFFQLQGKSYLLTVDRFSNWPDLREATAHTPNAGVDGLIKAYRELFATFGVPEHLSSDGGPEYKSKAFQAFMKTWGIKHRLASAYHPQSNGRAEVSVKAMKRLLRDNVSNDGKLDTDAVTRGILQLRNTPETDSNLSPAQILLGRTLRDSLPLRPPIPYRTTIFDPESAVSRVWKDTWSAKEHALKTRLARQVEKLEIGSHALKPLQIGDTVRIQNQSGNHPTKWDKTGTVVQIGDNDQYIVMVDGSRRLTLRNRRYLRKMVRPTQSQNPLLPTQLYHQAPATQQGKQQLQTLVAPPLQLPAAHHPANAAPSSPDPGPSGSTATPSHVKLIAPDPTSYGVLPPKQNLLLPTVLKSSELNLPSEVTHDPLPPTEHPAQHVPDFPAPDQHVPDLPIPDQHILDLPSATMPDVNQQARRPGRPLGSKKRRGFRETLFNSKSSSQPQHVVECPQQGESPDASSQLMGDAQPLVPENPAPIASQQRPHRIRKKPDWYVS